MLRILTSRSLVTALCVVALGVGVTSCGGAQNYAAKPMSLVEFLIVDQALQPAAPTGSLNVPRNALYSMEFSELVDPASVNFQTIQVRTGPTFQSIPGGSFRVTGNRVIYDPTIESDGTSRPFGLAPVQQHQIDIPSFEEQDGVIQNLDFDPNLVTFFTTFTTSDGFLRELVPPTFVRHFWIPPENDLTRNIPGNGVLALEFSEAMDPSSFVLGPPLGGPDANTTVDVRYTQDAINVVNNFAGEAISGTFNFDPSARIYFFRPTFSFGDEKLVFTASVFQNLRDLAGNLLINPQSMGPFTCDGEGIGRGKELVETFDIQTANDIAVTDSDWGGSEPGSLNGQQISSRDALIMGFTFADSGGSNSGTGQYAPIDSPLMGADRNNFAPSPTPATSLGRRVMWSFSDTEIGAQGSITAIGWGPDSNATFAATYEGIVLNLGYQANASTGLQASFSGNFQGSPASVFQGTYNVNQASNVGNYPGVVANHVGLPTNGYPTNPGCNPTNGVGVLFDWNLPLFTATGFAAWPALTTFFEWEPGDPNVDDDAVLVFDANIPEGDSFQQFRGWFGVTFPCSGVLLAGFPRRRMYAGFDEDTPNPADNAGAGIVNPEPSVTDTLFTVTRRLSTAQTVFYAPNGYTGYPALPGGSTFDTDTNFLPAQISPAIQPGGASVLLEFQAAMAVQPDRVTINPAAPFTAWTQDINDCDGFSFFRWRATLISNLISGSVPKVVEVRIPMTSN